MSGPKHTPGPWRIPVANVFMVVAPEAPNHNRREGMAPPYPDAIVCQVNLDNPGAAADARLIAAAPRLAEALKRCAVELAECIEAEYPPERRKYPSQQAKYEGDMEAVREAHAALREAGVEP